VNDLFNRAFLTRSQRSLTIVAAVTGLVGCRSEYDATLSGVVTLDGKPVSQGRVTWTPVDAGSAAYATIDRDGSYEVRTGLATGLKPGEYYVTVAANESAARTTEGGPPPPGKLIVPM
jgi:hypothetical protein